MGALERGQSIRVTSETGNLLRGEYDKKGQELWILDPSGPSVVAIDQTGHEAARFGRRGSGPGDLFVLPWYRPGHNLALVGDRVLVLDAYRLSQFTEGGRFVNVTAAAGTPTSLLPGASLMAMSDTAAILGVFQSRMSPDTAFATRASIRFFSVHPSDREVRIDTIPLSLVSKEWYAGGSNRSGTPFYNSFVFQIGETWAVSRGRLLALSFSSFGFCRVDPVRQAVEGAVRIEGTPRSTSNAERLAVHENFPGIDEKLPTGVTWGKELDDHWPSTAPWYMQIVAGDRYIAASRSVSLTGDRVDLFSGTSYVGSFPTPPGWLLQVTGISGDSLLRVEQDSVTDAYSLSWYHLKDGR
jgi:hypothetical protein